MKPIWNFMQALRGSKASRPVRRTFLAVALGCVFVLALGGCFGDDDNGDEEDTPTTTEEEEPTVDIITPPTTPVAPPTPTAQTTTTTAVVPPVTTSTTSAPLPPGDLTYTVKSGDTLANIAERFGVDIQELIDANDFDNPDLIFPGQVLTIPAG